MGEGWHEAQTRARRGRAGLAGVLGSAAPASSRIVGTMSMTWPGSRLSSPRAAIPFGQCDDERSRDAPFVHPGLVPPERRVRHAWTSLAPGTGACAAEPGSRGRVVTVVPHHDLGTGSVVGQEEDQRVRQLRPSCEADRARGRSRDPSGRPSRREWSSSPPETRAVARVRELQGRGRLISPGPSNFRASGLS